MPNENDVLINFTSDTSGLAPVENALDGIIAQSGELGTAWQKTAAAMNANTKGNVETTNKLSKSIEALATATKSMDKAVIGGAYATYLKQIQAQLGLTNKEVVNYIQNARKAAQEAIFHAGTDKEIDELTLSIEAMNEQLKVFGVSEDETGNKTQSLLARIREAKEELVAMAEAGLSGTPAFQALQEKAGHLDDQMRDLNATIKNTGSDTKNIDGVISAVSGLAGGFAVAQGTAALFGDESEDVQKALLKVNAAMSILQGLQQVQNVLQKESAAILLLQRLGLLQTTVATSENTVAREANVIAEGEQAAGAIAVATAEGVQTETTIALTDANIALADANIALAESQIAVNTAIAVSPIGLIITTLVALVGIIYLATRNTREYAKEQVALNDALEKATSYLDIDLKAQEQTTAKQLALAKQRGASVTELASIEGKAGIERLKTIDDARVAAAKAYNESKHNDTDTIEARKKLYDKMYALDQQYQEGKQALLVKGVEFETLQNEQAFKSFVAFQQAKVAATIAGSDNERSTQVATIRAIAAEREKSADFISLTDGEKAQKRAEDEKQIQGLQLANYQHYLKGRTALEDSFVAQAKLALIKNQTDTIASINAVTDAEIKALIKRRDEALKSDPNLNRGETKKIVEEANLQIAQLEKQRENTILETRKAGINAALILAQKGSEQEYNLKVAAINNEQKIALQATELTAAKINEINAKAQKDKVEAFRSYNEAQLQNKISIDGALLDGFGITENQKLGLTLKRLGEQRDLEISQAEKNGAKIVEINAKYDKQIIEEKKASINAILADNLNTLNVFSDLANQRSRRTIDSPAASNNDKVKALEDLRKFENDKFELQHRALTKQVEDNLLTNREFNIAYQDLLNKKAAGEAETEKAITAIQLNEIEKRTAAIQATFGIFQKGLAATLGNTGLATALTELQNFGNTAQDIMAKVKAGAISGVEGLKQLSSAAIGAMQNVVNQTFSDQAAARQQLLAETIQTLEDQKAKELNNKALTEEQKAAINKKYAEKEKQEKIRAFIADKQAKKEQAVINGLLAVTNALATAPTIIAGIILAALVAASTAIQVAKINSTPVPKFKHGKVDIQGPGTTTSDSIPARISRGESVIKADSTAKWKDALIAINNDKFEHYMSSKINDFVFPHVPDHVEVTQPHQQIDYKMLAKEIALEMKGIIPSPSKIEIINDREGQRTFIKEGNNRTEWLNNRYSMK